MGDRVRTVALFFVDRRFHALLACLLACLLAKPPRKSSSRRKDEKREKEREAALPHKCAGRHGGTSPLRIFIFFFIIIILIHSVFLGEKEQRRQELRSLSKATPFYLVVFPFGGFPLLFFFEQLCPPRCGALVGREETAVFRKTWLPFRRRGSFLVFFSSSSSSSSSAFSFLFFFFGLPEPEFAFFFFGSGPCPSFEEEEVEEDEEGAATPLRLLGLLSAWTAVSRSTPRPAPTSFFFPVGGSFA